MLAQMLSDAPKKKSGKAAPATTAPPPLPDGSPRSVTQLYGNHWGDCGYCHSGREDRYSYGMVCPTLNAEDYQSLIDLGWRRSGDYLYKQDNVVSCCCNYTIRLNVKKYTRNKAQRAAINRFERFLRGEHVGSTAAADEHGDKDQVMGSNGPAAAASLMSDVVVAAPGSAAASVPVDPRAERIRTALLESIEALVRAGGLPASLTPDSYTKQLRVYPYVAPAAAAKKSAAAVGAPAAPVAPAAAPSPQPQWASNAALVLSGLLRKQKQQEAPPVHVAQLLSQQLSAAATSALPPIQSFVAEPSGHLNFYIEGATATAAPATRRGSVSQDRTKKAPFVKKADSAASMPSAATAAPAAASAHLSTSTSAAATSSSNGKVHKFEVRQVPATFDATAFAVYKKYQMAVHGDKESKLTPKQYTNFLCNSPLVLSDKHPYGGFHHHYLLDDQLVAVGVVDVLPSCLSSVYLFYDPSFEFLNLGTVTAVKEIEWVQQKLLPNYPDIKFYYMGYYLHGCPKMLYKGKFEPSELLCPLRFTWHDLAACRPALDSFEATSGSGNPAARRNRKERCVILSDVAPEVREEDGSAPIYKSPSMVQRKDTAQGTATAAAAADKKKKRKKKKKKAAKADGAAGAAATAAGDSDSDNGEDGQENDSTMADAAPAAAATAAVSASKMHVPNAAAASSAAPASSSSSSSSHFPSVSPSSPYVFSAASLEAHRAHVAAVAAAAENSIPIFLQGKMEIFGRTDPFIQRQVSKPLREYAARAGVELAARMAVKFN